MVEVGVPTSRPTPTPTAWQKTGLPLCEATARQVPPATSSAATPWRAARSRGAAAHIDR